MPPSDGDLTTTRGLRLPAAALDEMFARGSGPGGQHRNVTASAVELVAEHDVPYVPVDGEPDAAARLVHVGHDPYFETIQTWGFPSDLGIRADAGRTLAQLRDVLAEGAKPSRAEIIADLRRIRAMTPKGPRIDSTELIREDRDSR